MQTWSFEIYRCQLVQTDRHPSDTCKRLVAMAMAGGGWWAEDCPRWWRSYGCYSGRKALYFTACHCNGVMTAVASATSHRQATHYSGCTVPTLHHQCPSTTQPYHPLQSTAHQPSPLASWLAQSVPRLVSTLAIIRQPSHLPRQYPCIGTRYCRLASRVDGRWTVRHGKVVCMVLCLVLCMYRACDAGIRQVKL